MRKSSSATTIIKKWDNKISKISMNRSLMAASPHFRTVECARHLMISHFHSSQCVYEVWWNSLRGRDKHEYKNNKKDVFATYFKDFLPLLLLGISHCVASRSPLLPLDTRAIVSFYVNRRDSQAVETDKREAFAIFIVEWKLLLSHAAARY